MAAWHQWRHRGMAHDVAHAPGGDIENIMTWRCEIKKYIRK